MAGTTPKYGFPYPTGTDRVMDGDNAIQALAESVEGQIGKAKWGAATVTTDASGNAVIAHGMGIKPAVVIGSIALSTVAWIANVYNPGVTTTNIHFVVRDHANTIVASTSVTIYWFAAT